MPQAAHILVVDDDNFVRKLIEQQLTAEGYKVQAEGNAEDGIAAIRKNRFDLLITDIVMPHRDGGKFIQMVRAEGHKMPIIAITAGIENAVEDYASYADMFADKTLTKPIAKAELLRTVAGALGADG